MIEYKTADIRNIVLMGHIGDGKTTLTEAMLYASKVIDRQGRVEDGTTVSDYDPEEIRRKISINTTLIPIEWEGKKINIFDAPGYFDFIGELMGPVRAAVTTAIVLNAANGIEVGTEKAWDLAVDHGNGKMFIINQMDRDNASFKKVVNELQDKFGSGVVPIMLPIGYGDEFHGVVDLLDNIAYNVDGNKRIKIDMPENMKLHVEEAELLITEAAASTSEELMEKYFEEGKLSFDEIRNGLRIGMLDGSIVPVIPCSAISDVGITTMMDVMAHYMPSPENQIYKGTNPKTGEEEERKCNSDDAFAALVFKTIADPFVGKLSLFKVASGSITGNTSLYNVNQDKTEKISNMYILSGKKQIAAKKLNAGDIGAFSKLQYTRTGDTLTFADKPIQFGEIKFPEPCVSRAVYAVKQGSEDKVFGGLARLNEEDPSIIIKKDPATTETLIYAQGEMHIDVIKNKLESKFGAKADFREPKIPYRETIRKTVKVQGKHKKQSGGHGQFGDVTIEFSPMEDRSIDFEFVDSIVGGAVPRNFIPSVEKGLRENIRKGVLAGYPIYGLRAKLVDGSYHPVDSSEMAFKTAARIAYKKGCLEASPTLLEPIMHVEIIVPNDYMGDVMGDMNKRRGRIIGMEQSKNMQILIAEAPMAELSKYATELRSMTQARGSFTMKFERYEEVPSSEATKVIEATKTDDENDD